MSDPQRNLDALNSYVGDNLWEDVLLRDIPGYDEAATERLDPGGARSDVFVADGLTYRYDRRRAEWIVES
jgi:hypothetical protein